MKQALTKIAKEWIPVYLSFFAFDDVESMRKMDGLEVGFNTLTNHKGTIEDFVKKNLKVEYFAALAQVEKDYLENVGEPIDWSQTPGKPFMLL
jgi:hypothetical protein